MVTKEGAKKLVNTVDKLSLTAEESALYIITKHKFRATTNQPSTLFKKNAMAGKADHELTAVGWMLTDDILLERRPANVRPHTQ